MADAPPQLAVNTRFDPQTGQLVEVVPGLARVTAPNASAFTFTGTNSFIIGHDRVAVVDPGPDDATHRAALLAAIAGRPVDAIILTHTHKDHSAGAPALRSETNAPFWFAGPHRLSRPPRIFEMNALASGCDWTIRPDRTLRDGEQFIAGGVDLVAIATPGHCANHMAFGLAGTNTLLTGDHIMGWNSTLVSVPDGSMGDYLASLEKVLALPYTNYVPAHGGQITDGPAYVRSLLAHRKLRNAQIVDAVAAGATRVDQLLDRIYPQLNGMLRIAAGMTLKAHIEYLDEQRAIRVRRTLFGLRLSPV